MQREVQLICLSITCWVFSTQRAEFDSGTLSVGDVYTSTRFVLVLTVVARFMCENVSLDQRARGQSMHAYVITARILGF